MKKLFATIGIVAMLTAASIGYTGCSKQNINLPKENGTIEVLFSKTTDCESRLEQMVTAASQVKAALYDLDSEKLIATLKSHDAELLIFEDNYAGLGQKVGSAGLMHDKFWLFYNISGEDYIATGSVNPTKNDFFKNDNNLVIISSDYLKKNYEAEFQELKSQGKNNPTVYQKIIFNGNLLENYFCPDDGCEGKVLGALKNAKERIYFMTFSFTSDPLGDYIVSRKNELDIKGVFDESQYNSKKQYSEYSKMLGSGMDVKLDGNQYKLHHKVFIIDNETVVLGSYNPTSAGTSKNDENILIIHDPKIASLFLKEFERVWQLANQ